MPQGSPKARKPLAAIEAKRGRNMRQLLLKASRIVNRHVVGELRARGYPGLRSPHTTLLSNIDLAGSSVTEAAERAGITKQAMGRLATELEEAGFIRVEIDSQDGRVKVLQLTDEGYRLMMDSLDAMADLEHRYARAMGRARLVELQRGLKCFIEEFDRDLEQTQAKAS